MCVCGQDTEIIVTATKNGYTAEFCRCHRCWVAFENLPVGCEIQWFSSCPKTEDTTERDARRDSAVKMVETKLERRGHGGSCVKDYGELLRIGHRMLNGFPTRMD